MARTTRSGGHWTLPQPTRGGVNGLLAGLIMLFAGVVSLPTLASMPEARSWDTGSGTTVLFVEAQELPIVDVRIAFDAGSARDGDRPGLARLTSELLLEGTGERDAGEIARGFEQVGARVSTGSERDMAWLSLRSLSREDALRPAVDLVAEVLADPVFPADAVDRTRERMRVSLRRGQQDPGTVAERAFMRELFGDHPYASPPSGTEAGLDDIERQDVIDFHRRYYAAGNATIAIVGDLDRAAAEELAERLSAALPSGEAAPALPEVPALQASRTVRIPFESEQTHVLMGQTTSVARGDERWPALYLVNHVLGGGGLVSMLAERMREERGLSYSSSSRVSAAAVGGWLRVSTQVRNDRLDEALEVLDGTVEEIRRQGPAAERLELSRSNITGSFPLNLDSNRDRVGYLAMMGFHDLPLDYLDAFRDAVANLGREQVAAVTAEVLSPRRLTVLVGPEPVIGNGDADDGGG
ncbi:M16 family metallopeptidase [Arhodomonas sp. SL1]|uniref:M16 family metallopeptidase n=1 Tax=Arhodomonas sp. SL1 TaxID=3425691 RepID=UPI003F880AE0